MQGLKKRRSTKSPITTSFHVSASTRTNCGQFRAPYTDSAPSKVSNVNLTPSKFRTYSLDCLHNSMSPVPNRIHNNREHSRKMPNDRHTDPPIKEAPREDVVSVQRHRPQHNRRKHIDHKVHARDLEPPPDMSQRLLVEGMHDLIERDLRIGHMVYGCTVLPFLVDSCTLRFVEDIVSGEGIRRRAL